MAPDTVYVPLEVVHFAALCRVPAKLYTTGVSAMHDMVNLSLLVTVRGAFTLHVIV
jgi:hypothetical protein